MVNYSKTPQIPTKKKTVMNQTISSLLLDLLLGLLVRLTSLLWLVGQLSGMPSIGKCINPRCGASVGLSNWQDNSMDCLCGVSHWECFDMTVLAHAGLCYQTRVRRTHGFQQCDFDKALSLFYTSFTPSVICSAPELTILSFELESLFDHEM